MNKKKSFILSLILLIAIPTTGWSWYGKVVGVSDGDTIKVMHHGKPKKIRLYGIDCPEKRQAFGKKAKQFTSFMVFKKVVDVESITKDRYKRTIGIVTINGISLNEELIRAGMAWAYHRYCKKPVCQEWKILQNNAREKRNGLWSDKNPIPPWKWRRKRR